MTEHGGGRDSDRNSADSWFRPSQNRHRTQSEYQDPLDEQREEEDQGTVFPDSGGYAGLGSARPEMVEPYPEALGGFTPAEAQAPSVPEEPAPSTPHEPQNPFVYPGAREVPHHTVEPMPWEDHGGGPGGYPNVAASADVPLLPSEESTTEWPSTGSVDHDASSAAAGTWSPGETASEAGHWSLPEAGHWSPSEAWTPGAEVRPEAEPWSPSSDPSSWNTSEAGPVGTGPPSSSDRGSWPLSGGPSSWGGSDAGPPVGDVPSDNGAWAPSGEVPSWGASEAWGSSGTDPLVSGAPSSGVGGSRSPSSEPSSWESPGVDPLGPGAPDPDEGEHWPPVDNTPSWEVNSEENPLESGGPSDGLGSWDAPGADPLGPGGPAPGESSGEPSSWDAPASGGDGEGNTSDPLDRRGYGDDGYNDELSGTTGLSSWAPGDRMSFEGKWDAGNEGSWSDDGYDDELSGPRPPEPEQSGGLGTGSGNTWVFPREDPRLPDEVRQAEQRRREDPDGGMRHGDWGNPEDTGHSPGPVSEDPLAPLTGLQSRTADEASAAVPPADGGATQMLGVSPIGDDQGASTQMFSPLSPESLGEETGRAPAGVPSDLGSVPSSGRRSDEDQWRDGYDGGYEEEYDDGYDGRYEEEYDDRYEEGYDDGFTPADYGMPTKPRRVQRRRLDISEDFPEFDDRPPGDDLGDGYPGYESVDLLADTEPGANHTLWLGVASLLPFVGVITALLALLVTGPKAKREIRASRGELDGLGFITTGTVFAVIGIVVTVVSLLLVVF